MGLVSFFEPVFPVIHDLKNMMGTILNSTGIINQCTIICWHLMSFNCIPDIFVVADLNDDYFNLYFENISLNTTKIFV